MITRYIENPYRTVNTLGKLMDEFFAQPSELRSTGWMPPVDVKETPTDLAFFIELPGVKQEDVEIEFVGESLTVRGKREFSAEEKRDDYIRVERTYGEFQRTFNLGVPVKADSITATFADGVLAITVPKAEEVQPRRIAISRN